MVAALISVAFLPSFFSHVSYDITGNFGGPSNTESQRAQQILDAEFPSINSNTSSNAILVLLQGANPYSNSVKETALSMNKTLASNQNIANYTGMDSVYGAEFGLLNSSLPNVIAQAAGLEANITSINRGLYILEQNLSTLSTNLYQLQSGINQTAQLVYGIPSTFVQIWSALMAQGLQNPYSANAQANSSLYQITGNLGWNPQYVGYYSIFYNAWNATFLSLPNTTLVSQRESLSIQQASGTLLTNPAIDNNTKQTVELVSSGLNVEDWNQKDSIVNLTISVIASSIPASLSSSLGVSATNLVTQLHILGPSPSEDTLGNYTISLFATTFASSLNSSTGFSLTKLLSAAYALGETPTPRQEWNLASSFIANSTESAFSNSPLFNVNSTALANLLSNLSGNVTLSQIDAKINGLISNQNFLNYPLVPTRAITENFVSKDNSSSILIFNFASSPDASTIAQVESSVKNSGLESFSQRVYVTGGAVITQDVQNVFTPALGVTIGPGVGIAILIVGLLFLSPVAALIPVLMGGLSIAIALPSIYFGIVEIGHGSITFLTPTLTTLLMLGLAVDYAVLQLRRTREERQNGKSLEESVGVSVRWAGQAVLTAGITVVVAYIVMAVANVPLFSSVGTAIALGVAILLAASLTLLPALELTLGDRMFWPKPPSRKSGNMRYRLVGLTGVTLKRKTAIAALVSVFALGAFYTSYHTPVGEDFLKLIPNFPSNQGLTAMTNAFGGALVSPTQIVIVTPTAITYGSNQFNQTLLNEIEGIANIAANSTGVTSVSGPTRPYGSLFNYSSIETMPEALRAQYQSGLLSLIGKDNKTALVNVGLADPSESQAGINSLLGMEKNIDGFAMSDGITIYFGGSAQQTYDSQSFIVGLLPEVIIILAAAVYVILFVQLRSAFTPLRLIFTILCSVVFSLAILSLAFYNIQSLPILDFAPLFVIVTMLGVGVDYDIFFVTRIREEVLGGKSDADAITTAVQKVWITILGLGLVLVAVFASLLITRIAMLEEIGTAVAGAILLDVLVIILFFVPALMGLAQQFNWWPSKIGKQKTNDAKSIAK
jgi:putative drug exporter of the RND superfamily